MRRQVLLLATLAFALPAALSAREVPGQLILNGDLTAVVTTAQGTQRFTGRMNGYFTTSGESFEEGARIEALNVALFGVDQRLMTGKEARGKPTGVLGFSVVTDGDQRQRLRYDARRHSLVGSVQGRIDMPQFAEMTELQIDPKLDYVEIPTMEATVEVQIALGDLAMARGQVMETRVQADMALSAHASDALGVQAFEVSVSTDHLQAQLVFGWWLEVAKRLCIQPVRILSFRAFPFFSHLSGDGLAFGQPGANTQWAKADVVFTYRDWITLFRPEFSTFSSDEAAALLAEVDVDDCIEVFFVDRFSPQTMWGGGATFGLGLASSKVITSDENADFGIDLTHLAHELGHVLALPHPTGAPGVSTGTLMCGSGFANDNPKKNSQENEDNLSNPLLTFALKLLSPGPDCLNSADCGPC